MSAYRGHAADEAPAAVRRTLPGSLRRAVLLAPGGNLVLGLALATLASWLLAAGVGAARFGEGYDARAVGVVTDCYMSEYQAERNERTVTIFTANVAYVFRDAAGTEFAGDYAHEQRACPARGTEVPVHYFPSTPTKNNHVADQEYRPIGHLAAWALGGLAGVTALVLLGRELARRRRVLGTLRRGVLTHARLAGIGTERTVDFWGGTETEVSFALPGKLELLGPVKVAAARPVRVMDDALEALVLEPPRFEHAVAVDLVPGTLRLSADAVEAYAPPSLTTPLALVTAIGLGLLMTLVLALA